MLSCREDYIFLQCTFKSGHRIDAAPSYPHISSKNMIRNPKQRGTKTTMFRGVESLRLSRLGLLVDATMPAAASLFHVPA
jgi:hypothetical protein